METSGNSNSHCSPIAWISVHPSGRGSWSLSALCSFVCASDSAGQVWEFGTANVLCCDPLVNLQGNVTLDDNFLTSKNTTMQIYFGCFINMVSRHAITWKLDESFMNSALRQYSLKQLAKCN